MSNDALAALGLDVEDAAPAAPAAVATTEAPAERAAREEVEVGEIEVGMLDFIPTSQRGGGGGGSKYKFDELKAPASAKGPFSYFKVSLVEGVDELKLKRSVQSATTQENKKQKDRGSDAYFVTRTINKDGKFDHILVIRTDVRPAEGEEEAAS
jgi:hypothetical protein